MDGFESSDNGNERQDGLACALRYAAHGFCIFPVNAAKQPLTRRGFKDATSDPAAIKSWLRKWPHCDFGWALPADIVVVDLDRKGGRDGFRDFRDRAGRDPHDVMTPSASSPSGGMHLFYKATKPYKNAVAIGGTGIDIRAEGGYVVLPAMGNGREWLRPLIDDTGHATLLPAPTWLDCVLRQSPSKRTPPTLAPRSAFRPPSSDSWARRKAQSELARACAKIVAAPCGTQDATRHRECFYIGGLIGRGDLGYEEAYAALLEAARALPTYRDPWRNLDERVARSIESGIARPLPLSETEQWVRDFRARALAKLSEARL